MHIPDALASLFDDGIIERVVRPLMSGKEAQVFLVVSQGELRVAKVYKDALSRSFKHRAEYTEGRKTRNSRDQRAVDKRSKHGRAHDEAAWKSTEVDMIHRLHAGGVRVPTPYAFIDGVLVMECVVDLEGNPAPRLGDLDFDADAARTIYNRVMQEVVRMLAVGVVHGDLSDFNVLVSGDDPVIIDFPQSVDTASNTNARRLLIRDVDNLHRFLTRFVPKAPRLPYAEEMWDLHENNALTADTRLTGRYRHAQRRTTGDSVIDLIQDADRNERKRRDALGLRGGPRGVPLAPPGAPSQRAPSAQRPQHAQHAQTPRTVEQPSHSRPPQHRDRGPGQPHRPPQAQRHDAPRQQHAHAPPPPQQGSSHSPHRVPSPAPAESRGGASSLRQRAQAERRDGAHSQSRDRDPTPQHRDAAPTPQHAQRRDPTQQQHAQGRDPTPKRQTEHPDRTTQRHHEQRGDLTTQHRAQRGDLTSQQHAQRGDLAQQQHAQRRDLTQQQHGQRRDPTPQQHAQPRDPTPQQHAQPDAQSSRPDGDPPSTGPRRRRGNRASG